MDSTIYGNLTYADSLEALVMAKTAIVEARYAMAAMLFLQLYEWVSCMEEEMRLIHYARWTWIKTLYLLCRYYPLVLWLLVMWAYVGDHNYALCQSIVHPIHALLAPCQFFSQGQAVYQPSHLYLSLMQIPAVMLMRAFAFSGRDIRILALLLFCYLGLVGLDIWVFCIDVQLLPWELFWALGGATGCFPNYGEGEGAMGFRIGYSMLAATLMDFISLVVVFIHCVKTRSHNVSLGRYFVSQGLTAFAFVSLVNIGTAIAYYRPPRYYTGVGLPLILVIANLVACRIILHLRAKINPTESELARQHSFIVNDALMTKSTDSWVMAGP